MHADCFACLAQEGTFPMKRIEDALGNIWHGQEAEEEMINHGVKGGHIAVPFSV